MAMQPSMQAMKSAEAVLTAARILADRGSSSPGSPLAFLRQRQAHTVCIAAQ